MYEDLSLFQKNWFINHGLGIHSNKILADSSNTKNTLKYIPYNLFCWSAEWAKIFGLFKKISSGVRSLCFYTQCVCVYVYVCVKSERTLHDYRCHY